jgi:chromosome segregation ATPase
MARRGLAISLIYIFHTVSFTQSLIPSSRYWVGDIGKSRDTTTPTTTSSNHHLYRRRHQSSRTKLSAFFLNDKDDNNKTPSKNNATPSGKDGSSANADLLQTLELKDEALYQAQTAVSSLEKALESAVTNLENMQQQLQLRVLRLEKELRTTKGELTDTMGELQKTRTELQSTREELTQSREERDGLDWALGQSQEGQQKAETRVEELETYLATLGVDAETITAKKKVEVSVITHTSVFRLRLTCLTT